MPLSPKKNNKSGKAAMPNTRQQESTRKERESMAAAQNPPPLPPRKEPAVTMPVGNKATPLKRKGDNLPAAQSNRQEIGKTSSRNKTEDAQAASNIMEEIRDESYKNITQEIVFFGSLSPEFKKRAEDLMRRINKVLHETIKITKEETKAETLQEIENRKCNDSLVLYNVQNMPYPQNSFYKKVRPEEDVVHALKKMTRDLATVLSATTLARTEQDFPMMMKVVLSDPMQKGTLFGLLAAENVQI
jgi:hypothetical protein